MSSDKSSNNPLSPLLKANEEEFFYRQNRELSQKLKAKAEMQAAGIADSDLADRILKAGFTEDSFRVLFFVPLVEVAWADRRVQDEERAAILSLASARGIAKGSKGYEILNHWLSKSIATSETFASARTFLESIIGEARSQDRAWLLDAAQKIAGATGGLFGLGSKVSSEEQAVIDRLAQKLGKS